jgi:FkbM family methyltransferase
MTTGHGLAWPEGTVPRQQAHALRHVQGLEVGLRHCRQHRTAVQAGGNVGLWPQRLSTLFARVITFEPDETSRACLTQNVRAPNVLILPHALGATYDRCAVARKSLGSHRVVVGDAVRVVPLDDLGLTDLDLLQLDIEGYEWHALMGAQQTIDRCGPVLQIELRGFTAKYGHSEADVREWLARHQYQQVATASGADVVFTRAA